MVRMAAGDAAHRQPAAAPGAMPRDRLDGVLRAGRQEPAARSEEGTDCGAIEADRAGEDTFHRALPLRRSTVSVGAKIRASSSRARRFRAGVPAPGPGAL